MERKLKIKIGTEVINIQITLWGNLSDAEIDKAVGAMVTALGGELV